MSDDFPNASNRTPQPPAPDEATLLARRRLLKTGFIAPAVLASFVLASEAQAQNSCTPNVCGPYCVPNENCSPYQGKK